MYKDKIMDDLPSISQLNKAGDIVRKSDDQEKIDAAIYVLSQWRTAHDIIIDKLKNSLYKYVIPELSEGVILSSRLKRMPSITSKIIRLGTRPSKMQDVAGVRIITSTVTEAYAIKGLLARKYLKNKRSIFNIVDTYDYIEIPKNDGYRSIHMVFEHNGKRDERLAGMKVELQIRSKIQHAWSTAVETFDLLNKSSIKMGQGEQRHREFFIVSSAAFSIKENTPVTLMINSVFEEDIYSKLKTIHNELNIIDRIKGIRTLASNIHDLRKKHTRFNSADYILLQLRIDENKTYVEPIKTLENAQNRYIELEHNVKVDNKNWEVVLVSMKDMETIEEAYPNYFLDASVFIDEINLILKRK